MIWIVWRGSGIMVLIYFFLSAWLCHYAIDGPHNLGNDSYAGWTLFWAAIATTLHAAAILLMKFGEDPNEPKTEDDPPRSIWHAHFFYIPVIIWPLIFGLLSVKFLVANDGPDDSDMEYAKEQLPPEKKVVKRTMFFLNSTEDTMYYEVSNTDGAYEYEGVEPHTYIERTIEPGKYVIRSFDKNGDLVYTFPSQEFPADKSLRTAAKDHDGNTVSHRIIEEGTVLEKDCDDIWVVLTGQRDMLLVDVTDLCHAGVTAEEVEKANWTTQAVKYDGRDIVQPLFGKDPGTGGTYTVLATGDDIPETLKKNERVFALMSVSRDQEITDEYLAGRITNRIPALASE